MGKYIQSMNTIFRNQIKNNLLNQLYKVPNKYWRDKLQVIILENASLNGRPINKPMVELKHTYGIHYNNRNWFSYSAELPEGYPEPHHCIPLISGYPRLEEELAEVTSEIKKLEDEEYEVDHFLSGLVLFPAPPHIFRKVLGNRLFKETIDKMEEHLSEINSHVWDDNVQHAMLTFVNRHQDIVKQMQKRQLDNLLIQDLTS